ncbi:hypothetical protein [Endozoicomonas sp. ALB032]|uniref:hypothetical protein n=1 Tax=Endozoicomonas sp. ALB032 TaxID=3403082 RepID=UPI003BB5C687
MKKLLMGCLMAASLSVNANEPSNQCKVDIPYAGLRLTLTEVMLNDLQANIHEMELKLKEFKKAMKELEELKDDGELRRDTGRSD